MTESSIRRELAAHGSLVYTNVGVSMRPLIRQGRDLLVIRTCTGRLRKYDIPLYQRPSGQYVLHRIARVLPTAWGEAASVPAVPGHRECPGADG